MKRYVKKPIAVEAVQYDGKNFDEVIEFAGNDVYFQDGRLYVHTLEGDMKAPNSSGDYVVKGIHGEFYICERKVFEESYKEERLF